MSRVQGAFTAAVEIEPGKVDALDELLMGIGEVVERSTCPIPFGRLTTVHFMRWVVLGGTTDAGGRPVPPALVLCTNYDEPRDAHLRELVRVAGGQFDAIYHHCRGYAATTDDERVAFLKAHSLRPAAFYVGTRGRGVEQIRKEADLRDRIQAHLDGMKTDGLDAGQIHAALREVFTRGKDAWVTGPAGQLPGFVTLKAVMLAAAAVVVPALGLWVLAEFGAGLAVGWWFLLVVPAGVLAAALLLGLFALVVRAYEKWERVPAVPLVGAAVGALVSREDRVVQNQLTNVVFLKPTLFRRATARAVLAGIHLLGRVVFVRGALGGIPSIHFARWVVVDGGRRLLFMSNFDGSWENYLGDFIDKASVGLTAIWSNAVGCPPARYLARDGARDEQRFKGWVRENQLVTQVWYSAYPDLSVENINNNTRIRLGLQRPLSGKEAARWLALL